MAARNHYRYLQYDSYEPFVQVRNSTIENGESRQRTHYFHCNQISIPREMTDKDGNFLWFGNYNGWCHLKENEWVYKNVHQTFRLQNQYVDRETGLHYNFFRYYKPERVGLWIRTRLAFRAETICISLRLMCRIVVGHPRPHNEMHNRKFHEKVRDRLKNVRLKEVAGWIILMIYLKS